MLIWAVIFFLALLGIVALFAVKYWETRTDKQLAPITREKADERALEFKDFLARSRVELAKLPPTLVYISRFAVHEAALGAAALARMLEHQSHRLADLVSHKHRFERRETNSEFLKQVSDYKNGSEDGENIS